LIRQSIHMTDFKSILSLPLCELVSGYYLIKSAMFLQFDRLEIEMLLIEAIFVGIDSSRLLIRR